MKRLIRASDDSEQAKIKAAQLQADLENTIGPFNTTDELWEAIDNMDFEEDGQ